MAVETSALHRAVLELDIRHGVADGLVTAETEFVPRFQQIGLVVGTMWVVALDASPFDGDLVGAGSFGGNELVVALETDGVRR